MPTEVISVIDPGGGGDYLTLAAWEADRVSDLVANDVVLIAELVGGDHTYTSETIISGATTDATHYAVVRAQAGAEYDPITGSGARIVVDADVYGLSIKEEGVRVEDIGFHYNARTLSASRAMLIFWADGVNSNGVAAQVSRCTFTCDAIDGSSAHAVRDLGSKGYSVVLRNLLVEGTTGGTETYVWGIRGTFDAGSLIENCTVNGTEASGIRNNTDTEATFRNCVVTNTDSSGDFQMAGSTNTVVEYCASSDGTADDFGGTGNITGIDPAAAFIAPGLNDFRLTEDSALAAAGQDLSASFSSDPAGRPYGSSWPIGAYRYAASDFPITKVRTIGTGGDYATIALWEADTDVDLVSRGLVEVGELLNETHTISSSVVITGATTDATHYRILRAQAGAEYDPITGSGAVCDVTLTSGYGIDCREEGVVLQGFGMAIGVTPTASLHAIGVGSDITNSNAVGVLVDRVAAVDTGIAAGFDVIAFRIGRGLATAFPITLRNCVVSGQGVAPSWAYGIIVDSTPLEATVIENCTIVGSRYQGLTVTADLVCNLTNVVIADTSSSAFAWGAGSTNSTVENCASDDATADDAGGTGNIINITPADEFHDTSANDFRLLETGSLWGAGQDLSADFTTDINGDEWGGHWNIGAYRGTGLEVFPGPGPFDSSIVPPLGKVTTYRFRALTGDDVIGPIPCAGARHVIAYLGELTSGTLTAGAIIPSIGSASSSSHAYQRVSSSTSAKIPGAVQGVLHGTAAGSNKASFHVTQGGEAYVSLSGVTGSSPIFNLIIEVHF